MKLSKLRGEKNDYYNTSRKIWGLIQGDNEATERKASKTSRKENDQADLIPQFRGEEAD